MQIKHKPSPRNLRISRMNNSVDPTGCRITLRILPIACWCTGRTRSPINPTVHNLCSSPAMSLIVVVLFSFISVCFHLFPNVFVCFQLFPNVLVCFHLFPNVFVCFHLFRGLHENLKHFQLFPNVSGPGRFVSECFQFVGGSESCFGNKIAKTIYIAVQTYIFKIFK